MRDMPDAVAHEGLAALDQVDADGGRGDADQHGREQGPLHEGGVQEFQHDQVSSPVRIGLGGRVGVYVVVAGQRVLADGLGGRPVVHDAAVAQDDRAVDQRLQRRRARAGRAAPWPRRRPARAASTASISWLARSTPAIGSSMISSSGSAASARAISTRWCWPPERALTESLARSARPTSSMARSTAARSALPRQPELRTGQPPGGDDLADGGGDAARRRGALRDVADAAPSRGSGAAACRTARQLAAGERDLADDGAYGGGLAGAVGAEQRDDLAAADGEVDTAQHGARAERGGGSAQVADHGFWRCWAPGMIASGGCCAVRVLRGSLRAERLLERGEVGLHDLEVVSARGTCP